LPEAGPARAQMMKRFAVTVIAATWAAFAATDAAARYRRPQKDFEYLGGSVVSIQPHRVKLRIYYAISTAGQNPSLRLVVVLPRTIPNRQRILNVEYSTEPEKIFYAKGNRYAEFVFEKLEANAELTIDIEAKLYRYDLAVARQEAARRSIATGGLQQFLANERYIDKDNDAIQSAAKAIATGATEVETVRNIYNYVIEKLEYSVLGREDAGAAAALQKGKGDCTEYSDLFAALCRARGIAARVVTGFTERFDKVSPKHHWVEVYLKRYGWVPFDASWGDSENEIIRKTAFEQMPPFYVYLSHIRNDPVLYNNHYYGYSYWGADVVLSDSVRFTQPDSSTSR